MKTAACRCTRRTAVPIAARRSAGIAARSVTARPAFPILDPASAGFTDGISEGSTDGSTAGSTDGIAAGIAAGIACRSVARNAGGSAASIAVTVGAAR
jgi:hypothetical protein